jgi:peptidoglycan/xylan/chitin deacetylase (PgdA/CDA1 family)
MSVEWGNLVSRLKQLNETATTMDVPDNSVLITFDDGWVDSLTLMSLFKSLSKLQPVLFLTEAQIQGNTGLLPLPRLYDWCEKSARDITDFEQLGLKREEMKALHEMEQHAFLDRLEVPKVMLSDEIIDQRDMALVAQAGWLIGSHAHDHHDLRFDNPEELESGLLGALETTMKIGGVPWIAWPEGRCTKETCEIARGVGFEKQFALNVEAGMVEHQDLIQREIWS